LLSADLQTKACQKNKIFPENMKKLKLQFTVTYILRIEALCKSAYHKMSFK
jgi:hypothetical protein